MEEIEDKQLAIEGRLYTLSPTQLKELAESLEIPAKYAGKSRMIALKAIRDQMIELIGALETTEEKKIKLIAIETFIEDKPLPLEDSKDIKPTIKDIKQPLEDNKPGEIHPKPVTVDPSKIFRRDFKIKGQIGSSGEGNHLSFISLARQIETAVSKGYEGSEIEAFQHNKVKLESVFITVQSKLFHVK